MATSLLSTPLHLLLITLLHISLHLLVSSENSFTFRAATIEYWNHKVPNNAPHPDFFLSLLSPLREPLSSPLTISPSLCHSAHLLCPNITFFQATPSTNHDLPCIYPQEYKVDQCEHNLFFLESELKEGKVMPMTDIRDKMPLRSFLPRSIVDKIPFEADAVKSLFGLERNTGLGKAVSTALANCQMSLSRGEIKWCVTSAEDMIDFAVEMLGNDIVLRSTESPNGSGQLIMIGKVNEMSRGKTTRSVSCHQMLFPYMVYYCHTVPKIKLYEAEILSVESKKKINKAVAVCHPDMSAGHAISVALGGNPSQIEVCHWLFNGDMAWVIANKS